jgi:hypothetical protein
VYHVLEISFSVFSLGFFSVNMRVVSDEHGETPLGHFRNGREVQWKIDSKNGG